MKVSFNLWGMAFASVHEVGSKDRAMRIAATIMT